MRRSRVQVSLVAPDYWFRFSNVTFLHRVDRLRQTRRVWLWFLMKQRIPLMNSSFRAPLAVFLTILMISHVAAAATSVWNGPSGLAGSSRNVADAFEVPGNATVIDAWLHVDESGYLEDGYGETWTGLR